MYLLWLLTIVLLALLINYIVSRKFEEIAFLKGYDESAHSFAMCFWLGVVGWIYVLGLPNKTAVNVVITDERYVPSNAGCMENGNVSATDPNLKGKCAICHAEHQSLRICRVKNGSEVREVPLCEQCIAYLGK